MCFGLSSSIKNCVFVLALFLFWKEREPLSLSKIEIVEKVLPEFLVWKRAGKIGEISVVELVWGKGFRKPAKISSNRIEVEFVFWYELEVKKLEVKIDEAMKMSGDDLKCLFSLWPSWLKSYVNRANQEVLAITLAMIGEGSLSNQVIGISIE